MKPAGAHTLFVIDDDAAVRAAVQGCATQRWTQLRSRGAGLKNDWPSPTRLEQLFHRPGSMRALLSHEGAAPASVPQPHLPANPLEQYSVRGPSFTWAEAMIAQLFWEGLHSGVRDPCASEAVVASAGTGNSSCTACPLRISASVWLCTFTVSAATCWSR